jgi:hypothetical protein
MSTGLADKSKAGGILLRYGLAVVTAAVALGVAKALRRPVLELSPSLVF